MKRGRKFVVPLEEQKKVFLRFKKYFSSRSDLPASTDPLFGEISTALANKITKQALYLSAKKNFDYFFSPNDNICCEETSPITLSKKCDNTSREEKKCKDGINKSLGNTVTYDFLIDTYQWERLQPITKRIKLNKGPESVFRMKNLLPKHQWAHLLREKIWEIHPIAHSWTFKQYSISMNTHITCVGSCKQCEALVKVIISWPSDKIAQCKCIITNYDKNFIHTPTRKIKLSPVQRTEIAEELKHVSAISYRNSMANDNLFVNSDEPEPTHLPTTGCLRQIKHEHKNSSLFHQNQILSLWLMTQMSPYKEAIQHISVYPFYIYYWDPCQDKYCKEFKKTEKLIVSIDATGSIFKTLGPLYNVTITKHILFYVCVMKTYEGHSSIPLTQMVSESQSMDTIYKWLEAWHVSNPKPDEIIVDESSALIGACVKAFTKYNSTKEYVTESYRKLEENEKSDDCYIRIDTSHFVKIIFNLNCFKHVDNRVKFFYIKCLLALKECVNFEKAKEILTDIITVCLNEHDGFNKSNTPSRCDLAKNRLKTLNQFQTLDTEIEIQNSDKINDLPKAVEKTVFENKTDTKLSEENRFLKWFTNKIETEKLLVTLDTEDIGNHDNLYYYPVFIGTLSRLLNLFPLWSNVMKHIYDSEIEAPTSSNVESYFKTIKRLLLNLSTKSHRLRTDEFIMKHLEFLKGEIKVAPRKSILSNLTVQSNTGTDLQKKEIKRDPITSTRKRKLQSQEPKEEFTDDSIFAEDPTFIENWKGKGNVTKKRKTLKPVIFLSNGGWLQIDKKICILRNTCAIDSLCQALAIAYIDGYRISHTIHASENLFCKLVRLMSGRDTEEVYKIRFEMAQAYFSKIEQECSVEVRCECNVNNIFERILIDCIYSADEREHCTESDCAINRVQRKIPVLHVDINSAVKDLQESANALINAQELTECRRSKCKGVKSFSVSLRDLIAFEFHSNEFISIDDPPTSLLLEGSEFHLLAIIEFVPPVCETLIGHYKAHCRRNSQWKCYDDESKKITKSKKKLIPRCIIYAKK